VQVTQGKEEGCTCTFVSERSEAAKMGQDLTKLTPDELKARQIKEMDAEMKHKLQRGANYNSYYPLLLLLPNPLLSLPFVLSVSSLNDAQQPAPPSEFSSNSNQPAKLDFCYLK
jgi:hypothetical protein